MRSRRAREKEDRMEERMLDEDENRGIRIKRTADGETDAMEGLEGDVGDEVAFEFPEEYDETLAGMTQEQVEAELRRREKAREEALAACNRLIEEGNALLAEEKFEEAEEKFAQATAYDIDSQPAAEGLFTAATKNFTDSEHLYSDERAEDLERLEWGRKFVAAKYGDQLREEQKRYRKEAEALRPAVDENHAKLREAFAANKRYYLIWTCVALFLVAAFAVATAIAADSIFRTKSSMLPVIITALFGVMTFAAVTMFAVFCARLLRANRLCRMNEEPDATSEGTRLLELENRIRIVDLILAENGSTAPKTEV